MGHRRVASLLGIVLAAVGIAACGGSGGHGGGGGAPPPGLPQDGKYIGALIHRTQQGLIGGGKLETVGAQAIAIVVSGGVVTSATGGTNTPIDVTGNVQSDGKFAGRYAGSFSLVGDLPTVANSSVGRINATNVPVNNTVELYIEAWRTVGGPSPAVGFDGLYFGAYSSATQTSTTVTTVTGTVGPETFSIRNGVVSGSSRIAGSVDASGKFTGDSITDSGSKISITGTVVASGAFFELRGVVTTNGQQVGAGVTVARGGD